MLINIWQFYMINSNCVFSVNYENTEMNMHGNRSLRYYYMYVHMWNPGKQILDLMNIKRGNIGAC